MNKAIYNRLNRIELYNILKTKLMKVIYEISKYILDIKENDFFWVFLLPPVFDYCFFPLFETILLYQKKKHGIFYVSIIVIYML